MQKIVVLIILLIVGAVPVIADRTMPGNILYPIKANINEPIRKWLSPGDTDEVKIPEDNDANPPAGIPDPKIETKVIEKSRKETPDINVTVNPYIKSLDPASGKVGQTVSVTGEGFTPASNSVRFGDGYINSISSTNSGRNLKFQVPAGLDICPPNSEICVAGFPQVTPGTYKIKITNASGTSNSIDFTVTP